jgi:hypothetical protein
MCYILLWVNSEFIAVKATVVLFVVRLRTRTRAVTIFANGEEHGIIAQFRYFPGFQVLKVEDSLNYLSEQ